MSHAATIQWQGLMSRFWNSSVESMVALSVLCKKKKKKTAFQNDIITFLGGQTINSISVRGLHLLITRHKSLAPPTNQRSKSSTSGPLHLRWGLPEMFSELPPLKWRDHRDQGLQRRRSSRSFSSSIIWALNAPRNKRLQQLQMHRGRTPSVVKRTSSL